MIVGGYSSGNDYNNVPIPGLGENRQEKGGRGSTRKDSNIKDIDFKAKG